MLLARIRAQLRQHEQSEDAVFAVGPYTFKPAAKMLLDEQDKKIRLTEKETNILKYLYRANDAVVPRDVLLHEVWGYNAGVTTHTLETHIYRLRQKIEPDPSNGEHPRDRARRLSAGRLNRARRALCRGAPRSLQGGDAVNRVRLTVRIATWNINSVRLRAETVARVLREEAPDVLCLQETKAEVEKLPLEVFAALGYVHVVARGQKSYNGVMTSCRACPRTPAAERSRLLRAERRAARRGAARLRHGDP